MNRHQRLTLEILRQGRAGTMLLRKHGVAHPAGRVQELREMGFEIDTMRQNQFDSDGIVHRQAAVYVLRSEPK